MKCPDCGRETSFGVISSEELPPKRGEGWVIFPYRKTVGFMCYACGWNCPDVPKKIPRCWKKVRYA